MEAPEVAMASYSSSSSSGDVSRPLVIKRRRTRRLRAIPPASGATTVSSSTSSSVEESGFIDEEDMANCLILLAQGGAAAAAASRKFTSKRFAKAATTMGGRAGFYVYECKTCSKCFPSFQALGGHRASHKKLKMAAEAAEEEKKGVAGAIHLQISMNASPTRMDSALKGKVHECSICRSEFSSGQALGGHMRRHRAAMEMPEDLKKEKSVFALDLNLPAPAEEDSSFAIAAKPLVFPQAAALVDCNY